MKVIISGGGTGGHVFPAIAIANALKEAVPDIEILFVGAIGKIEMDKVPAAGYKIVGLPVSGFIRKITFKNFKVLLNLIKSLKISKKIINDFKPDVVVGVGGYASGPLLWAATGKKIPAVIQEQNSYAGITNKLLAKRAAKICVAYEGMERFFPKEKIILTGNPVRKELLNSLATNDDALKFFNLENNKKTILFIGGSLGAKTINTSIIKNLTKLNISDVQIIWQTGKFYYENAKKQVENAALSNIKVFDFISRMDLAFAAADLVVSRAGAGTISELCLLKKPVIFVPSPNVTEDHQTKNAMALVNKNAALIVKDTEAEAKLIDEALVLINDDEKLKIFSESIANLALKNSDKIIANEILKLK